MSHLNYKENQYLQATEAALEKIHGGIECGYLVPQLNLIEAQRENEDIDDLTLQVSDDVITSDPPRNISNEYNVVDENQLNMGQKLVFDCCKTYFQAKREADMHGYEIQNPIHILVHGGPGTGKSFLTRCINNAAQEMEMEYSIMCVAFTGIAAANLPNALGQIDNRLRQLMGKPESPFGGFVFLLMGATMKLLVDRKEIENGDPGPRTYT
ncbi:hypothetical protein OUZ56_026249 [Daphnia magna]|uniref:ATP-dependent DNA helicase n=1 Tax=Daphnia magna TaxID=35525 RepID=A0ABQ9ZL90_9CRUS|nr:hypothetical protein OUZ56_026249 [Daphnia magna]